MDLAENNELTAKDRLKAIELAMALNQFKKPETTEKAKQLLTSVNLIG